MMINKEKMKWKIMKIMKWMKTNMQMKLMIIKTKWIKTSTKMKLMIMKIK